MKFQIDTCPLCNKNCQLREVAGLTFFTCPNFKDDGKEQSHYYVEYTGVTEIQRIYIYPYLIDTFLSTNKSRIYYSDGMKNGQKKWEFIVEVTSIHPDIESKMLERINKLLTFL